MHRATLLYNPNSGRRPHTRKALIESVAQALRSHGLKAQIIPTEGPDTAGRQAAALSEQTDILFACGGDGTGPVRSSPFEGIRQWTDRRKHPPLWLLIKVSTSDPVTSKLGKRLSPDAARAPHRCPSSTRATHGCG